MPLPRPAPQTVSGSYLVMNLADKNRQDKATGEIMESLAALSSVVMGMRDEFQMLRRQTDDLYAHLPGSSHVGMQHQHLPHGKEMKEEPQEPVANSVVENKYERLIPPPHAHTLLPANDPPYSSTHTYPPQSAEAVEPPTIEDDAEETEEESGDPGPLKPPSIPVNHTTGAARLLLVPVIAEMCHGIIKDGKIKNEKYPIHQEQKRGFD